MTVDLSDENLYNPKYIPILHSKRRYVHLAWGWGSWKSFFEAQKEIGKTFERGNRLLGIRKVKDTIRESIYGELVWVIEMWGLQEYFTCTVSPMQIVNRLTGSDIVFRGMDDPEKVKSITKVTRVWIEEATELEEKDFNQLDLRLRGNKELQITLTYNTIDKDHWLNGLFWVHGENENTSLLHTTYKDNKWAGDAYEVVMNRLKEQDMNMYNIYALGEWWNKVEGLIFQFEEIDSVPEEAEKLGYGLDFWFTNDPSACNWLYKWNWWIIVDEEFYRTGLTNPDIVWLLKSSWVSENDLIVADSSEPKSIEEIHRAGFDIQGAVKWPDSVMFGIQVMKQVKIYITKRSQNTKKEFLNYCWAKDKNGKVLNKPIDAFNHAIDDIRYIVTRVLGKEETYFIGTI